MLLKIIYRVTKKNYEKICIRLLMRKIFSQQLKRRHLLPNLILSIQSHKECLIINIMFVLFDLGLFLPLKKKLNISYVFICIEKNITQKNIFGSLCDLFLLCICFEKKTINMYSRLTKLCCVGNFNL